MKASRAKGLPATHDGGGEAGKPGKGKTRASEMLSVFERLPHVESLACAHVHGCACVRMLEIGRSFLKSGLGSTVARKAGSGSRMSSTFCALVLLSMKWKEKK